ncbi:MAG: hypothetical protein K8S25_08390 [Alphaproteobacteria bacterium]|nr:hypothetical protein [Alphaproteobacteria bacterium]
MRRLVCSLACASMLVMSASYAPAFANSVGPTLLASYKQDAVRFSAADNTLVRVYFAHNPVVWTGLPPEMARNFARGKVLPRGITIEALPHGLLSRLPARPGFGYARLGQDVALINQTTNVVADLIENVFD